MKRKVCVYSTTLKTEIATRHCSRSPQCAPPLQVSNFHKFSEDFCLSNPSLAYAKKKLLIFENMLTCVLDKKWRHSAKIFENVALKHRETWFYYSSAIFFFVLFKSDRQAQISICVRRWSSSSRMMQSFSHESRVGDFSSAISRFSEKMQINFASFSFDFIPIEFLFVSH